MTYRERREARAERLREWADKREAKAEADLDQARQMGEAIPFGQPILVGHHSEKRDRGYRGRMIDKTERGIGHARKAESMNSRAANIEAQLDASIYDDDTDAIERLTDRIDELEAERTRIKAYNASCRRGAPDLSVLAEAERRDLETIARVCPHQLGKGGALPAYKLSNLGGNIGRLRKRLAALEAQR